VNLWRFEAGEMEGVDANPKLGGQLEERVERPFVCGLECSDEVLSLLWDWTEVSGDHQVDKIAVRELGVWSRVGVVGGWQAPVFVACVWHFLRLSTTENLSSVVAILLSLLWTNASLGGKVRSRQAYGP